jgi:hypothetical protein
MNDSISSDKTASRSTKKEDAQEIFAPNEFRIYDLYVVQGFHIVLDHVGGVLSVSAFVGNDGTATTRRSVEFVLGITYRSGDQTRYTERVSTLAEGIRPGDIVETAPTRANLVYFNEDLGAKYKMEAIVDLGQDIFDVNRANNTYYQEERFYDPAMLAKVRDSEDGVVFTNGVMGVEDVPGGQFR